MAYIVVLMKASGSIESYERNTAPKLNDLQKLVGGSIQEVPHFRSYGEWRRGCAYANEEGILLGLDINAAATRAWKECLGPGPFSYDPVLYGDVVFFAKVPKS